jgi:long-chain acyl-CoA synthetase
MNMTVDALDPMPLGDPRIWAHSLQDLVRATLRDAGTARIRDVAGTRLRGDAVWAISDRLAAHGVRAGDVVLVKARNDLDGVSAVLGAWLHGCAVCPVDPSGAPQVHELIARHSGARIVVEADGSLVATAPDTWRRGMLCIERPSGVDLAVIIFTSGSSGVPKGVLLSHSNVMSALRSISTFLEISAADRVLSVPPLFLDYGLYQVLFSMFTGCELVLGTGITSPLKILSLIKDTRPTVLPVVPALAVGLARVLDTFGRTVDGLRVVSNTGGHLARATIEAMMRSFPGAQIVPMYGLTESKRALYLPSHRVADKPDSVGGPMPGLDARVVVADSYGQLVEAHVGVVGELYVRGSSVMQGYHSDRGGAGAQLIPGRYRDDYWLATGDLFETDADGCLYFRGRSKSLIKQGGYCIYPRDLEAAAEAIPNVSSAVVVGREETDGDESAVLFVVLKGPGGQTQQSRVRDSLLENLHRSIRPRIVHFLDEWPALPVGKIDIGALKALARDL